MDKQSTPGYSGKPLMEKLNWKPEFQSLAINLPDNLPDFDIFSSFDSHISAGKQYDFIIIFQTDHSLLKEALYNILPQLAPRGILWVCRPKQTSQIPTNITENSLRDILLPIGLVDIKVCAISEDWSGLKFMRRR